MLDISSPLPSQISLTEYFAVLEDPDASLTLNDVRDAKIAARFTSGKSTDAGLGFGFTKSAYWLRFTLRNNSNKPIDTILELAYSRLTHVEFHQPADDGNYHATLTGSLMPFNTRPYPNRFFVFPITVPADSVQVYFLQVRASSALLVPASLWEPQAYHTHERNDYIAQAWYFGIASAMILFNIFLFIAIRDVVYLMYVAFVTCMAFTLASHHGLIKEFISIDSASWSLSSASIGYALTVATATLFMRHMLKTWLFLPRFDYVLKFMTVVYMFPLPLALALAHQTLIPYSQILTITMTLIIMGTAAYGAYKKLRSAYFFLIAFAIVFLGSSLTSAISMRLVPVLLDPSEIIQLGSSAEMLLLAFALADRYNHLKLEKEHAQNAAAKAQDKLVETLRSSERVLELRVSERTTELQQSNSALQITLKKLQSTQYQLIESEKLAVHGQQMATQALAEQRQFIAMVSHEFRSPLAVIDSSAQLLTLRLAADSANTSIVRRIRAGVARLANFLDNCLTQDRIDNESDTLILGEVEMQKLIIWASDVAATLTEQHKIVMDLPDKPITITGDQTLLRIMLTNLISNAIKYSPPDTSINLRLRANKDFCEIGIQDQGLGISQDDLSQVFKKYKRGKDVGNTPGAGLGLAIVARIVHLHDGRIEVKSQKNKGTEFIITIPFAIKSTNRRDGRI